MPVLLMWLLGLLLSAQGLPESVNSNSFVSCDDVHCKQFPSKNALYDKVIDFRMILVDNVNDKIFVGARDYVFRLDPKTFKVTGSDDVIHIKEDEKVNQQCYKNKGKPKELCHNFIRVLDFDNDGHLFVCGTYSFSPMCWKFPRKGNLKALMNMTGEGRVPFDPNQNTTAVFNDEFMYTGISGINTKDTAIFRLKTLPNVNGFVSTYRDSSFLNEPNFVSSYSFVDNFIYFIFRESAIEEEVVNNRKVVYSRIARVCKYDVGEDFILDGKFTSFIKTRLSCSVPGKFPFHYDNIQGTFVVKGPSASSSYLYAVFTTPDLGAAGSAVCRYSLKNIQHIFQTSDYMTRDDNLPVWLPVKPPRSIQDPGRPKCDSSLDTKKYNPAMASYAKDHPLLYQSVTEDGEKPLFTKNDVRFTQVVVDMVMSGSSTLIPVIFIGTSNGTIYKLFSSPNLPSSPFVIEQIRVFQDHEQIYSMKIYKGNIYVGGESSAKKVPVQKCSRYVTCRTCIIAQDPYCGWSNGKCMTKLESGSNLWHQDIMKGNFSKICPEAPPRCTMSVITVTPYGDARLECATDGIPLPWVSAWSREGKELPASSSDGEVIKMKETWKEQFLINRFSPKHTGVYQCHVQTVHGKKASCSTEVKGSLPEISSGFSKDHKSKVTRFWCEATGHPAPSFFIHKKSVQDVDLAFETNSLDITPELGKFAYYCIAQNAFGPSVGETFYVDGRQLTVTIKLTSESWSSDLQNINSTKYWDLVNKIKLAFSEVYKDDYKYLGIAKIDFSEGSVICEAKLDFISPRDDLNYELLASLQMAVSSGTIYNLSVDSDYKLSDDIDSTFLAHTDSSGTDVGLFIAIYLFSIILFFVFGAAFAYNFHRRIKDKIHGYPSPEDNETPMSARSDKRTPRRYKVTKENELSPMNSSKSSISEKDSVDSNSKNNKKIKNVKDAERSESQKKLLRKSEQIDPKAEEDLEIDVVDEDDYFHDACSDVDRDSPVSDAGSVVIKQCGKDQENKFANGQVAQDIC